MRYWKAYCNMTTATDHWTVVYKLAAGKRNASTLTTTIQKPEGTVTDSTEETVRLMMDKFTPEDNERDDNEYHKIIRSQILQPRRHT